MSSWTPGRDLEDRWSLDMVPMSDLDETFTDTSDECFLPSDTISRSIRNVHVLLESMKRHGGQEKS